MKAASIMKHLNTLLLFVSVLMDDDVAAAANGGWKLQPSSKILLQRELGKSKSGKLFFGGGSKSSKSKSSKASRSKQSSKSAKSNYGQFAKSAKAKSSKAGDIYRTPPPTPAEETATKFLETEDKGDYRGLRTQNMILVTIGALAILATIAALRIKSRRAANAEPAPDENRILDSVEVSAVVGAARPKRPPPPRTARAPVGGTDNSCDFFGFHNCLA